MGLLFDLFNGNIRVYKNDKDQGLAVSGNKDLMKGGYYLTLMCYSSTTGTFSLVSPPK